MYLFGLRLAVTSYRRRHHGDVSSASLQLAHPALCIKAAGQNEAQRAENGGRRPILRQRSSGHGA